jgi:hypothetical protein
MGKNINVTGLNLSASPAKAFPVIDANYTGTIITFNNGEDPNCKLSGFVLTRGVGVKAGAILCDGASPQINHCIIVGNRCYDPNQNNPLLADPNVGIMYCCDSNSIFNQCTISGNYGGPEGAAFHFVDCNVMIANSIVTNNLPEQIHVEKGNDPLVNYCNIEDLWPGGIGNIDADPNFAMEGRWLDTTEPFTVWIDGDYHLASRQGRWDPVFTTWKFDLFNSPCIDAGDPGVSFYMEPLPNGERVNMGAYGGTNQASLTRDPNTRPPK